MTREFISFYLNSNGNTMVIQWDQPKYKKCVQKRIMTVSGQENGQYVLSDSDCRALSFQSLQLG